MKNDTELPSWTEWVEPLLLAVVINVGTVAGIGFGMAHGYGMWKFWWE